MPTKRNATSDYMADNDRLQELQEQIDILIKENKTNTAEYKKLNKEYIKELEKTGDNFNDNFKNSLKRELASAARDINQGLRRTIDDYIGAIENLSYSLNGNIRDYSDITSNLNRVLNGQNLVKQADAFNNLTKIIHAGIINNAEQKAFLQTLSSDLGMQFNASSDTMRQLIRIQGEDSTANRMAIEYSLNEFLVQNYQTGEYIRQGFERVSNALLQSQSTMSAAMAASYEATVQTWMGSLYSVGLNGDTISQLAAAIDAVGSGNIKNLGSGISNLVLMGAARSGLDYGELLNRGFQGNDVNRLMSGITGYISEMSGNSSNIVMSQMADLFGLQLSDIMALRNNNITVAGGANADAEAMLKDIGNLVPGAVRITNALSNLQYGWGANIASNENLLTNYMLLSEIVEPLSRTAGGLVGSLINERVGNVISNVGGNASLLTLLPQLAGFTNGFSGGFQGWNNILGLGNFGALSGMLNSNRGMDALSIWQALGVGGDGINNTTVVTSSAGTSGSMGFSRNGGGGLLGNMRSSLNDLGIEEVEGDQQTIDDHIISIDNTVQSIFDRLGRILDTMPSNTASGVTYGERSYSGAAFV